MWTSAENLISLYMLALAVETAGEHNHKHI